MGVVWPGDAVSHVVATRGRRFEPRGSYAVDPLGRWARKGAQVRCKDFALKKTKECAQGGVGRDRSISRVSGCARGSASGGTATGRQECRRNDNGKEEKRETNSRERARERARRKRREKQYQGGKGRKNLKKHQRWV